MDLNKGTLTIIIYTQKDDFACKIVELRKIFVNLLIVLESKP